MERAVRTPKKARPTGARRSRRAPDSGVERDLLASYLADIGDAPTLTAEEELELARDLESTLAEFREHLLRIPWVARELVQRWHDRKARGLVTGKLAEPYPGSPLEEQDDTSQWVDARMAKIERQLARPAAKTAAARKRAAQQRLGTLLETSLATHVLDGFRDPLRQRSERLLALQREEKRLRARPQPKTERGQRQRRERLSELRRSLRELQDELGMAPRTLAEHQRALEEAWQHYTALKNRFVRHNLRLVIKIAREYQRGGVGLRDLIQEGNIGLVRAVEKFDHRRGFKFSTYAVWWIRQALVRAIQYQARTIRVPTHVHEEIRRYRRERDRLEHELGGEASVAQVARACSISVERAHELETVGREAVSLDLPVPGTETRMLSEVLVDPDSTEPGEEHDHAALERATRDAIADLDRREQFIVRWRFGLDGAEEHTLEQIGEKLGISRERVRQIEKRILEKLRGPGGVHLLEHVA